MRALVFFALGCLLSLTAPVSAQTSSLFDLLRGLDGKSFSGRMTYPDHGEHEMNKPMRITVEVVSESQIRIPLQVGEDRSRTWILTRSSEGLQLKHDHRHADGTPDEVTNYGGIDRELALGRQAIFPADQETAQLLPEASSNAWSLRMTPDGRSLVYYLERHQQPRFEATFDLSVSPVAAPDPVED